eukprot:IDg17515t1
MLHPHESMWTGSLEKINATEHRIDLAPGTRQIRQHPYGMGLRSRQIEVAEVDRMIRLRVIQTSKSEWDFPECIDSLGHAKVFTELDANWGYWQTPMAEEEIPPTAFTLS